VTFHPVSADTFAYTVGSLRRIMTVAVQTGMPVYWC
jgi:hypothetical protein